MNYQDYIHNKKTYLNIQLLKYGGAAINWNNIKIIKELGKGHNGTTYSIKINNKIYALKRQKITQKEHDDIISTTMPINRELMFFKWIDRLPKNDKIFFMEMYGYRRYECDFNFVPIRGSLSDELRDSKYCQDIIVSKKDSTIENIINDLDKNSIISVFCQSVYAIHLMHSSNYYHFDTKLDNICYTKTKNKKIKLGAFGKIKTMGLIISIIDYGQVLNDTFQMNEIEKELFETAKLCNVDLFLLIEYVLMNNIKIYNQIDKQRISIKPKEVYDIIKTIDSDIYNALIGYIHDDIKITYVKDFDTFLRNEGTFEECRKNPKHREILYEIMQIYQLLYPEQYYGSLNKYFDIVFKVNDLLFSTEEILFVKKNHTNLNKILTKFIKQSAKI